MRKNYTSVLLIMGLLFCFKVNAQNNFFKDVKESSINTALGVQRVIVPQKYRTISLDTASLLRFFKTVPLRKNISNLSNAPVFTIALPNGSSGRFYIWESPVMEPALAAKYPMIKTYSGQGIDDATATIKLDWTVLGFRAMILSAHGTVYIDPYTQGSLTNYIAYYKSDYKSTQAFSEMDLPEDKTTTSLSRPSGILSGSSVGTQLRTYRWAITCTSQYASAATGFSSPTLSQVLSAITLTVNRVNGVYENELSVSLVLVANEDAIIFNDPANDPLKQYNANPSTTLFNQGQNIIDDSIGNLNYDIGEIFTTGAGGASFIGIVCQQNMKAKSAVGITNPVGDPFNIDYVCHEVGHEFGAHHPFNSQMGSCGAGGQLDPNTNVEPGSGSTIVGYASNVQYDGFILCNSDNLQADSDPYFNTINFDEITDFINNSATCAVATPTVNRSNTDINHAPVVNAGSNYTIPKSTPFVLTGSATDQDDDTLSYCWEEYDIGGANSYGAWNAPTNNAPIFRSFLPVTVPFRYFPKLSDVINNDTTIGEIMPSYARTLHFRLTARDNRPNGGGVSYSGNAITVDGSSGPFVVTYPDITNIKWTAGEMRTVTWNPAGTQNTPVSCSNVSIQLSTDGGLTFPDTLIASTPNTGSAQVLVPDSITTTARIRVTAVGNVFYDMSNNNFTILDSTVPVIWINFSAVKQSNNTALLNWTVDELNVKYYQVERRTDSSGFQAIDSIASITGNGSNQHYSFIDKTPFQGTDYYRIKEINADGSFTYSTTQSLAFAAIPAPWTIYPNPANSYINILSNANSNNTAIQLFDAAGKLMYQKAFAGTLPGQLITIPLVNFAKGVYVIRITSTAGVKELPLLID